MIGLIKDSTANSTVIAELEEAIRSGTVTSDARLPTENAISPAASGAISSVTIATSSGAFGATSNAACAMLSGASGASSASSNAAGAMLSGAMVPLVPPRTQPARCYLVLLVPLVPP